MTYLARPLYRTLIALGFGLMIAWLALGLGVLVRMGLFCAHPENNEYLWTAARSSSTTVFALAGVVITAVTALMGEQAS